MLISVDWTIKFLSSSSTFPKIEHYGIYSLDRDCEVNLVFHLRLGPDSVDFSAVHFFTAAADCHVSHRRVERL